MGKSRSHWCCFPFPRLTSSFRRCPPSKSLIIGAVCVVYLVFVVSQVGHSPRHRDRRTDAERHRRDRGSYGPDDDAPPGAAGSQTGASFVVPTRANVVYITLKSKRLKPAKIRGTVRPKLRRKAKRNKAAGSAFAQNKADTLEGDARQLERNSWAESVNAVLQPHTHSRVSAIRIYSQRAPPWFSAEDVGTMRFLADAEVLRVRRVSRAEPPPLLVFDGEARLSPASQGRAGRRGVVGEPVDTAEVFAFHLDRVLGLNRTLPAVGRKFSFLHDGQPCPVVSWDASLYPEGLATGSSTVRMTWGKYQSSLKQRCWHKNSPKSDSGCTAIHHYEWSKLALFDFLLQIHNRLDPSCCGFRPRQEDACVGLSRHAECRDQDHILLSNIIHRNHDPRHLVFTNNKGFFDRNEDNLDFRLLEGIKELPEQAVTVMRSRRLREKLLQSLFLDQTYWESQGGRQGIDKLIDVIERRAKVLLTYINAHGIKVIAMNV